MPARKRSRRPPRIRRPSRGNRASPTPPRGREFSPSRFATAPARRRRRASRPGCGSRMWLAVMIALSSARSQPAGHSSRGLPISGTTRCTSARALSALSNSTRTTASTVTWSWSGMPAVEVGHHRDGRVVQLGLARELRLRHVGHADDAAAPGAVQLALRLGGELRAFHHQVGAAARHRQAERRAPRLPARRRAARRPDAPSTHARRRRRRRSSSRARSCGR